MKKIMKPLPNGRKMSYSLADPAVPQEIGWSDQLAQPVVGIQPAGGLVYVGLEHGIAVLDVSNPTSPQTLAVLSLFDRVADIALFDAQTLAVLTIREDSSSCGIACNSPSLRCERSRQATSYR
jgi:hypothetical protein